MYTQTCSSTIIVTRDKCKIYIYIYKLNMTQNDVITHLNTSLTRKWAQGRDRRITTEQLHHFQLCFTPLKHALLLFHRRQRTCHENPKMNTTVFSPSLTHAHTRRDTPSTKWQQGSVYTLSLSLANLTIPAGDLCGHLIYDFNINHLLILANSRVLSYCTHTHIVWCVVLFSQTLCCYSVMTQ